MDSAAIQQLLRPRAFPHQSGDLKLCETHISWVILSGEFAYKIKKPVNLGFLDFSTVALREHFCQRELVLNKRFAPHLYLEVVPVTRDERGLRLSGDGPVIDYAVKMRRFDEDQLLANIAARGELDRPLLRDLARELARLHRLMPVCRPAATTEEPGTPASLHKAVKQNFSQIREYPIAQPELEQLAAVERWSLQRYAQLLPVMEQRVLDGWVIDGHGDAHLGNIALVDSQLCLFDCIEFSPAFRVMDSVAEIAFLSMDLDARGYHGESHCLLTDYLEYRGDYQGLALLNLYRCYFAVVRAKVALLRESPTAADISTTAAYAGFLGYLQLARTYNRPGTIFLAITHGVSGSGKSTIADKLVAAGGAVRLRSDVERKRLFGLAPEQRSRPEDEEHLYSAAMSRKTFTRLELLARATVKAGFAAIVDATFLHRRVRDSFRQLANELAVPFIIIDCSAEPGQLRQRLLEREQAGKDASEAGVAVMESQLRVDEPLSAAELDVSITADSAEGGDVLWQRLEECCKDNK